MLCVNRFFVFYVVFASLLVSCVVVLFSLTRGGIGSRVLLLLLLGVQIVLSSRNPADEVASISIQFYFGDFGDFGGGIRDL